MPAFLIYAALYLYPVLSNFRYALTKWDGIVEPEFVGLRNLQNMLTNDDLFLKVFGNNLEFTFLVVIFQTA
ncbi:sugar ABC transporter permease, partial [bacterium]|nr:sugar ABC transporter permease [bacterium]